MKKIFYILDPNGEFYSTDRTKRYKQLTGQALYAYLKSEEGKKKYFDVWKDDDRDVMIGVEVPPERAKRYAAEQRRRRYVKAVMKELDISITSLDIITDAETESFNGEQILPILSVNLEEDLMDKFEREELHKAIQKLTKEEQKLIFQHYFDNRSETELSTEYGISQQAISKKIGKIREKIKKILKI